MASSGKIVTNNCTFEQILTLSAMSEESALFLFDLRERVKSLTRNHLPKIKDLKITPALIETIEFRDVMEKSPRYIEAYLGL